MCSEIRESWVLVLHRCQYSRNEVDSCSWSLRFATTGGSTRLIYNDKTPNRCWRGSCRTNEGGGPAPSCSDPTSTNSIDTSKRFEVLPRAAKYGKVGFSFCTPGSGSNKSETRLMVVPGASVSHRQPEDPGDLNTDNNFKPVLERFRMNESSITITRARRMKGRVRKRYRFGRYG